jgi:hypothetical protein
LVYGTKWEARSGEITWHQRLAACYEGVILGIWSKCCNDLENFKVVNFSSDVNKVALKSENFTH